MHYNVSPRARGSSTAQDYLSQRERRYAAQRTAELAGVAVRKAKGNIWEGGRQCVIVMVERKEGTCYHAQTIFRVPGLTLPSSPGFFRGQRGVTYQYNTVPSNKVHRTGTMFVYYKAPRNSVDSSIDTTIIVIYIVVIHMGNRVQ